MGSSESALRDQLDRLDQAARERLVAQMVPALPADHEIQYARLHRVTLLDQPDHEIPRYRAVPEVQCDREDPQVP